MLGVIVLWSLYTQHAWEDFYISFRASRNLALGNGLVYQVGERLHSFTSPLHTLLLAGLAWLVGPDRDPVASLWLYRVIGGCALGGALYLLHDLGRRHNWTRLPTLLTVGFVALDSKSIDFAASGMEVPLTLFFLALNFHALLGSRDWRWLGVAWSGLMWTRPDAFIFIGAGLGALFVFGGIEGLDRRAWAKLAIRAGLLVVVLYGPWLVWAHCYYGSFVPFTIVAKAGPLHDEPLLSVMRRVVLSPKDIFLNSVFFDAIVSPAYAQWEGTLGVVIRAGWWMLAVLAWLYWLAPWGSRIARTLSLTFFLATLYGANFPFSPWYAPPYVMIEAVTCGFILADFGRGGSWLGGATGRYISVICVAALFAVEGVTSVAAARLMRWKQEIDETTQRKVIGLWLRDHAKPGDTVFLECLGYIGYYSGLKMYDYPGLSSREVVDARRRLHTESYGKLIAALRPEWLVLRPGDLRRIRADSSELLPGRGHPDSIYELVKVFDHSREVAAAPVQFGRWYLQVDQCFELYHRRASGPSP